MIQPKGPKLTIDFIKIKIGYWRFWIYFYAIMDNQCNTTLTRNVLVEYISFLHENH